jgi:hypothetical protein
LIEFTPPRQLNRSASSIKTCTGGDNKNKEIDYLFAPDAAGCARILFTDATNRPACANEH